MIGVRIKEERERLGMTQPQFAEAAGAAKRTLIEWEKGSTSPTAVQLSALMNIGVDVLYILTGMRPTSAPTTSITLTAEEADVLSRAISKREAALLDNYRHITDEEDRKAVERTVFIAARPAAKDETQSRTQKKAG